MEFFYFYYYRGDFGGWKLEELIGFRFLDGSFVMFENYTRWLPRLERDLRMEWRGLNEVSFLERSVCGVERSCLECCCLGYGDLVFIFRLWRRYR